MVQKGRVISTCGEYAVVEIIRESACSSCHNRDYCGASVFAGCSKKERMKVKALNSAKANDGQLVELTSDSLKTIGITFCVFVLPLIFAMLGYFLVSFLSESNAIKIVSSFVIFLVSFFALFFGFDRLLKDKVSVEISAIIEE